MTRRITIVTNGHFADSPRVWREADALTDAGFDVIVVGAWVSDEQAALDLAMSQQRRWRFTVAADLRPSTRARWRRVAARARGRLAREASRRLGVVDIHALAIAPGPVLRAARATRADLFIVHLETGLWVGRELLRDGHRVAVDLEDWHRENRADQPAAERAYLRELEAVSQAYGVPLPIAIYNSDPDALTPKSLDPPAGPLRLLWFSQTLGLDRGLDDALRALTLLADESDWTLSLLGRAAEPVRDVILGALPPGLRGRVCFLEPVTPTALAELTCRYDVGLALERKTPRSRDLTLTNKIFRYLQSGLFVAATDTQGQRELLELVPAHGRVYPAGDAASLARILGDAAANVAALRAERSRRAADAARLFAYEAQASKLVACVEAALAPPSDPTLIRGTRSTTPPPKWPW
jgi:glycosyltransferase involved in cell wall biosynthesis